jgi:hypothetical protein
MATIGMIAPRTGKVDRSRHQFLAGAAFAGDQHGGIGGPNGFDCLEDPLHCRALAHHIVWPRNLVHGFAQPHIFLACLPVRERVLHQMRNLIRVQRLGHIVIGAVFQRCHRRLH